MILAPYTLDRCHPEWRSRLEKYAPEPVTWVQIDPKDTTGYARALVDAWAMPGDLTVVEHDIGIHPHTLQQLAACRQPWCGHPYLVNGRLIVALGCTRFTSELKTALPGLAGVAAAVGDAQDHGLVPAGHWCRLDVRIAHQLELLGHRLHWHWPRVDHFHHYPQGGVS